MEVAKVGQQQIIKARDYTLGTCILPGGKEDHGNILWFVKAKLVAWSMLPGGNLYKWYNKIYITVDCATAVMAVLNLVTCRDLLL